MVMTGGKRREMRKQDRTGVLLCVGRVLYQGVYTAEMPYSIGRGIECGPTRNVRPSLCRCNGDGLCSV